MTQSSPQTSPVVRLLNADTGPFVDEARAVLRTGLETAPWISVDDTGARHQHRNGYCTQVGNATKAVQMSFDPPNAPTKPAPVCPTTPSSRT